MSEVHDFLQELPKELSVERWPVVALERHGAYVCPYCSTILIVPRLHLLRNRGCMEALAEANGKWEAEHGVAK